MEKIYPEIHYRKLESGIMITACYGDDGIFFLPDEIEGIPVTSIAPYAFAQSDVSLEDEIWRSREFFSGDEKKRLIAERLWKSIYLKE